MEPPSAPAHGGRISWHRLLLAVSLLSFWNLPATAQITIESVPFKTAEGRDVLLLAHNATEDTLGYSWYRGERVENNQLIILYRVDIQANTTGPAYSGREIIYPNGSLLFQNATQNDTGYYTLMVTKNDLQREIVTGLLRVYPPVTKPIIEANSTTVTEQKDTVVLTCIINDTEVSIRWLFNGQSLLLTERIKLSQENSTLTIEPVRREDAGNYQCEASNPGNSSLSDPLRLDVKYPVAKPIVEANSTTVTEHEDTVVLKCLTNDTGVAISWFFNGQSLLLTERMELSQDNGTLTIEPVRREDAGHYQCEASHLGNSSKSDPLRLDVKYPVAKPIVEANSTTVTEHEDTVVLKCLTNDTGVAISWFFNGQSLLLTERMELSQDNGTLTIEPVRREDAGHYQCEASHLGNSSKSDPLRLDVKYPVAKPIVEANSTTVTEHEDTVVLKCLTNDTGVAISWFFNGQSLLLTERMELSQDNGTLTIEPVRREDAGHYQCEASHLGNSSKSDPLRLDVKYPVAKPIVEANSTTVTEHEDTVVLKCLTNDTGVAISWFFNGQSLLLTERMELSQDNGTLTIEPVRREDAGHYQCEASHLGNSSKSDPLRLDVKYPVAKPIVEANSTTVTEHEDTVVLKCLTNDTGVAISWFFNGQSLLLTERMELSQDNGTLTIEPVRREDAGHYQCEASHLGNSSKSDPLRLDVKYPVAKPIVEANSTTVTEHEDTVVLKCLTNDTGVAISWFFNGQSLLLTERMELSQDNGTLTIEPVRREDAGHYQCEASHLGNSSKSDPLRLDVKYPVAKPIVEANSTTVTEHEDTVVLKCLTNDTGVAISWFFNGQSLLLTERMELSQDNGTLTIEPVRREDAGHYQCEASHLGNSSKSDPLRLDVKYDSATGLSSGAVAGIVTGALAGVALIGALVYILCVI
ncbi:carcinoembryonic antigen-related cell adhesion molecule 5-like isoform X4 [Sus scrofa]|uniref:carcinoembryonic antigen-related cell adhesion molecule 5-like isoform X4 n=1 Tax=Sus scrofa TaxID=9823 RepID=UPI000A2B6351|nr:carcinoembryonic antigen-related cell adhesion molecule 5-like isoform X4 [Sus scrofa]